MNTIAMPRHRVAYPSAIVAGVLAIILSPLFPVAVWVYGKIAPVSYTATATFDFYPGHPVDAEEGRRATWNLLPRANNISLEMVTGDPHVYKLSVVLYNPDQAAIVVNAYLDQAERKATSEGQGSFRIVGRAALPVSGEQPRTGDLYFAASGLSLCMVLIGYNLLADRLQNARIPLLLSA